MQYHCTNQFVIFIIQIMEFKRIVISCLLLVTYTLGFAHSLIPHCEAGDTEHQIAAHEGSNSHHHHEHHQHAPEDNVDHEHIIHNGHLDGGLYDFIVCLLSDAQHPRNDCNLQHYLPAITNDKIDTKISKTRLVATLFALCCIIIQNEELPSFSSELANYLSPHIEHTPYRGPPSFSC